MNRIRIPAEGRASITRASAEYSGASEIEAEFDNCVRRDVLRLPGLK